MSTRPLCTEQVFVTPETITWLLFDSIVCSFGSLLHSWPGGTIDHFSFETSPFLHHLSTIFSPVHRSYYTNVTHFCHHFSHLLLSFSSKPITGILITNTILIKHTVSFTGSDFQFTDASVLLPITELTKLLAHIAICTYTPSLSIVFFPFFFRSIIGVDVTFHPTLFDTHILWIDSILLIIQKL